MILQIPPDRGHGDLSHLCAASNLFGNPFLLDIDSTDDGIDIQPMELVFGQVSCPVRSISGNDGTHLLRMLSDGNVGFVPEGLGKPAGHAGCVQDGTVSVVVIIGGDVGGVLMEHLHDGQIKEIGCLVSVRVTIITVTITLHQPNHLVPIVSFLVGQVRQGPSRGDQEVRRTFVAMDQQPNLGRGPFGGIVRHLVVDKGRRRVVQRWIIRVNGILDRFDRIVDEDIIWTGYH
mmetsp:Transcript_12432/g.35585  ORF Transcript_12432/g.35585 Transcript_12432/m.35585 type:complete len:232 (-) Transcript_12432:38-733(-)